MHWLVERGCCRAVCPGIAVDQADNPGAAGRPGLKRTPGLRPLYGGAVRLIWPRNLFCASGRFAVDGEESVLDSV